LITIQQSIGRGLRLHETKEQLVWWDIIDDLSYMHPLTRGPHKGEIRLEHNYCYNHFLERMDIYTNNSFQCFSKEFDISTL